MAYTASPQFNTYKTVPVSVSGKVMYRNGDTTAERDLQIVNMYYDTVFQDSQNRSAIKRLKKRPGIAATAYSLSKSAVGDDIRGYFYDPDQNAFYWAVNNKIYAVKPDVGTTVRTVATLTTSSGMVGFCSYLKSDNTRYVCASDGTDLWIDDHVAGTCAKVVDVDLPTPHEPSPVYINGYIFLIKKDTGDIYNSDLDNPTSWTPGDFITAEISSDYLTRLYKSRNYIIALGNNSVEYFYDAGIATGSPLQRNDSPVRSTGYISGMCQIADALLFVGQDLKENVCVYSLDGFNLTKISTPVVEKTIQTYVSTANAKSRVLLDKLGYSMSVDGHTFYVLPLSNTTWAYDINEKEWYEWKNSDGTGLAIQATWTMINGSQYVAVDGHANVGVFSPSVYQDYDENFTCRYTSEIVDADTFNWKYAHRLFIDCSQEGVTDTSNVVVTWSDKDWKQAAAAQRNINVFSISPQIHKLGRFRKRSFRFEYTDNYPFWLRGFALDINVGQT
jgi:hypothetical protein